MKKVYYTCNGMGTGKTQRLLDKFKRDYRSRKLDSNIIFLDTIEIMDQYEKGLLERGVPFLSLRSQNNMVNVKQYTEKEYRFVDGVKVSTKLLNLLKEARGDEIVILTTKKSLSLVYKEIDASGWNLYFDENIQLNKSQYYDVGSQLLQAITKQIGGNLYIEHREGSQIIGANIDSKDKLKQFIKEEKFINLDYDENLVLNILELLEEGYQFTVNETHKIGTDGVFNLGIPRVVRIEKMINQSKTTTFLASGFTRSFTYLYLKSKGFDLVKSEIHQEKEEDFKMGIEIIPLLDGDKYSKHLLSTDKEIFQKMEEQIKKITKGEPYLSHQYSWHNDVFQSVTGEEIEDHKRKVLPFFVKGVNSYTDYHICVSFVHGNVSNSQISIDTIMLQREGIDVKEGLEALRFERGLDIMAQALLRASARLRKHQTKKNLLIVPTTKVAEELRGLLNSKNVVINYKYIISLSPKEEKMITSIEDLTPKQREMLENHKRCIKLLEEGYNISQIDEMLNINSRRMVRYYINHKPSIKFKSMGL